MSPSAAPVNTSPPPEEPEFHGKTLSPASPIPVHMPDASIPVLANQIDPIFNDTATHLNPQKASETTASTSGVTDAVLHASQAGQHLASQSIEVASGDHENGVLQTAAAFSQSTSSVGESDPARPFAGVEGGHEIISTAPSPPEAALESLTASTLPDATVPIEDPPTVSAESVPSPQRPASTERAASSDNVHGQAGVSHPLPPFEGNSKDVPSGVNIQALLDSLLPSASEFTATAAPTSTEPLKDNRSRVPSVNADTAASSIQATSSISSPTVSKSPLTGLPSSKTLPPRPPPQEKATVPRGSASQEDIRTFHRYNQPSGGPSSFHLPPSSSSQPLTTYRPLHPLPSTVVAAGAPGTASQPIPSSLPPPPVATFQKPPSTTAPSQQSPTVGQYRQRDEIGRKVTRSVTSADEEEDQEPWGPDIQKIYDEFLADERAYVTEGQWDRFPPNSRLFIGNLPTEKVTKRDLFHIFHKHGKLAQVSIKQAYGFVQFLHSSSCSSALQSEQGQSVRGRKMRMFTLLNSLTADRVVDIGCLADLEISKPQRNTRNAATDSTPSRAGANRRSRSPDYGRSAVSPRGGQYYRGNRSGGDRVDRAFDDRSGRDRDRDRDFRDRPRVRDDYRPARSPSPRREHDEYRGGRDRERERDRSRDRFPRRSRSRSPYGRTSRYRSRSPRARELDEDSDLPLPRRDQRDVPELQVIILDDLDRNFTSFVEKSFRDRGIRTDVLHLNPRLSLSAVVRRQILEGVQAVVKLTRRDQSSGKISLQVFDRRAGVDKVRFDEYESLEPQIAAELVYRAKQTHGAPNEAAYAIPPTQPLPYGQGFGLPHPQTPQVIPQAVPQAPAPQSPAAAVAAAAVPNLANLITSLDGPTLQKLLGVLQQQVQTSAQPAQPTQVAPQAAAPPPTTPDLASLLGGAGVGVGRPASQVQAQMPPNRPPPPRGQPTQPSNPFAALAGMPGLANGNPAIAALLAGGAGGPVGIPPQLHSSVGPPQMQHTLPNNNQMQNIMDQLSKWKKQ
ncbi:MAG: hypothetical protein M1825_000085 [Sarcosagium campestre]|nr:MAG: hypothetical protein M1825_000085 [Sarcosagium campestre]